MKVTYKGFEIDVSREKSLGGWSQLYYSVFTPTGYELVCGFEDSDEKVKDKIEDLKETVDDYIKNPENYDEDIKFIKELEEAYKDEAENLNLDDPWFNDYEHENKLLSE